MTDTNQSSVNLRRRLGLFPLAGVLTIPHGLTMLRVFEPRYLELLKDAMESDLRIGVVQPRSDKDESTKTDAPQLFTVGCEAAVAECVNLEKNVFQIKLVGMRRFKILKEIPSDKMYRIAEVSFEDFSGDTIKPNFSVIEPSEILDLIKKELGEATVPNAMLDLTSEDLFSFLTLCASVPKEEIQWILEDTKDPCFDSFMAALKFKGFEPASQMIH